jgi:hypothetical protein
MSHFKGHFEGAKTFFVPLNWGQKSQGTLKMSQEMAHKVIVPKKNMSQIFLNSSTLVILCLFATMGPHLRPTVS